MFIYIFEDFRVAKSLTAPKSEDLAAIADGILTVLRCVPNKSTGGVDVQEVLEDGQLGELPSCSEENDETGEYHYLSGHE